MNQFLEVKSDVLEITSVPLNLPENQQILLPLDRALVLQRGDLVAMPERFRVVDWRKTQAVDEQGRARVDRDDNPIIIKTPDTIEVAFRVIRSVSQRKTPKIHYRHGRTEK